MYVSQLSHVPSGFRISCCSQTSATQDFESDDGFVCGEHSLQWPSSPITYLPLHTSASQLVVADYLVYGGQSTQLPSASNFWWA